LCVTSNSFSVLLSETWKQLSLSSTHFKTTPKGVKIEVQILIRESLKYAIPINSIFFSLQKFFFLERELETN
jgi:hypothetical protein